MANYRFKQTEIEQMKDMILTNCKNDNGKSWRLRLCIEGLMMCCRPSKRERARLERELALYERLTKNDIPNWN